MSCRSVAFLARGATLRDDQTPPSALIHVSINNQVRQPNTANHKNTSYVDPPKAALLM